MSERTATRLILATFALTTLASLALIVLYIAGGNPPVEGILLATALASLGVGLVLWSRHLVDPRVVTEERNDLSSPPEVRTEVISALTSEGGFSRRRLLAGGLFAAVGAMLTAAAVPILSLGPSTASALRTTSWRKGLHLVDTDGNLMTADRLPIGSVATVFPEGAGQVSDSATVLVHVDPATLQLPADRAAWAPDGLVAYSKLCTHVGCPVGLYIEERHTLLCPCHQSEFDVLTGAQPVAGPAGRPLPQLPIALQPDGTLVALGDFTEPVGPSYWDMYR